MEKLREIFNLFAPYVNTIVIIAFVYELLCFMKEKNDIEQRQTTNGVHWRSHSLRQLLAWTLFFHLFSFATLFLNRIEFFKESTKQFYQFGLFFGLSLASLFFLLIIGKVLFKRGETWLLYPMLILIDIGYIMIYRLRPSWAMKQLQWLAIGLVFLFFIPILFKYIHKISRVKWFTIGLSIMLVILTLAIGKEINGSKNWLGFGFIQFQPSELIKILFVFFVSIVAAETTEYRKLVVPGALAGLLLLLFVLQKDLGSVLIFSSTLFVMMYAAGQKKRYIYSLIGLEALGAGISYLLFSHIRRRVAAWMDPWQDVLDVGYQVAQGLFGIASGGWIGTGLMLGMPRKIPIVETDYMFAAICEELGAIFGIGIIIIYLIIVYQIIRTASRKTDTVLRGILVGFACMTATQAFVIIGGVIKLIPLTGVTLPFISYGGSSFVSNLLMMGLIMYFTMPQHAVEEEVRIYE